MNLTQYGKVVSEDLMWLGKQYPYIQLDVWIIMPNHLHAIIFYDDDRRGDSRIAPTKRKPLGRIIGALKTVSTKHVNEIRHTSGTKLWQRSFYDHIIRSEKSLQNIRHYIVNNPLKWESDRNNPKNLGNA